MHHLTTLSGIEWHYELTGPEEGGVLLFLHGWGVDCRIWRQQAKYFAKEYRVMSVDLPGHGGSTWKKISLEEMARDIYMILDKEEIRTVSVIGSSLGGMFALKLYEVDPKRIEKLGFVGAMPKFAKSDDYPHGLDIERMKKLGGQLQSNYPVIVNVFFRSLFTKQERASRRYKWLQKFRQTDKAPMRHALAEYLDLLEREDLRHVLVDVQCPIQFVNGTGDEICTRETVAHLKELAPRSKFVDFEQCGHFPFLSKPHEFNETLSAFLHHTEQ